MATTDEKNEEPSAKQPPRPSIAALCRAIRCRDAFDMERYFAGELRSRVSLYQMPRPLHVAIAPIPACVHARQLTHRHGWRYDLRSGFTDAIMIEDLVAQYCDHMKRHMAEEPSIWAYSLLPVTIEKGMGLTSWSWQIQYHHH